MLRIGEPLEFEVGGERLLVSRLFWNALRGPLPPEGFSCDGCSNSPDQVGRWKIWPACVIHDYHYRTALLRWEDYSPSLLERGPIPGTAAGRKLADDTFFWNVVELLRLQGASSFTAHRLAWLYWGRVRIWGASSFQHWDTEAKPKGFWSRVREVW